MVVFDIDSEIISLIGATIIIFVKDIKGITIDAKSPDRRKNRL
jgi:hypothetical protein